MRNSSARLIALFLFCAGPVLAQVPELAALQKTFEAELQAKVRGPFAAELQALNARYLAELDRTGQSAQSSGKLEDVLLIQKEKERVQRGDTTLSLSEMAKSPVLKPLQSVYQRNVAKLEEGWTKRALPIAEQQGRTLDGLVARLTKEGKIDQAKEVADAKERHVPEYAITPGPWVFKGDGGSYIRTLRPDGFFTTPESGAKIMGTWAVQPKKVVLRWNSGHTDVLYFPINAKGTKGRADANFELIATKK